MTDDLALFLVVALYGGGEAGCSEEFLLTRARTEAWPRLTAPDLQHALQALADERLALWWKPKFAGVRWKLTEQGVNALREKGLAS